MSTTNKLVEMVAPVLEKAVAALERGADWMAGEIPAVIQELLLWKMWESGVLAVIGLVLSVLLVWGYSKLWKYAKRDYDPFQLSYVPVGGAITGLILIVTGTVFLGNLLELIKIVVAPRVWLLEYAASVLK